MYRLIMLMVVILATAVWAQDPAADEDPVTTPPPEEVEGLTEKELEDLNIDGQEDHTEEDEDVFKPTDAVSYSQQIRFPVDI
jgi:hypothetical protein